MAFDFPNSPALNATWPNPPVVGQPVYMWDGEKWLVVNAPSAGAAPATALPLMDSIATVGVSVKYAREDHVHPAAAVLPLPPCGRLCYSASTPVPTGTINNCTVIHFTAYKGGVVYLWNGTNWSPRLFSDLATTLTDTTKNPSAIGASKVNDWFIWDDAGTLQLSHGPDWTSVALRPAGSLTMLQGIWMNTNAITNACAAFRGVYVGTTFSNAGSKLDHVLTGGGFYGFPAYISIWNMYNRVLLSPVVREGQFTMPNTTVASRYMNGNPNNAITFVTGMQEDTQLFSIISRCMGNPAPASTLIGMGLNGSTMAVLSYTQFGTAGEQQSLICNLSVQVFGANTVFACDAAETATAGSLVNISNHDWMYGNIWA